MSYESLIERWKREVYDKATEVDIGNIHDWDSLAYGFAMGAGLSPVAAEEFVQAAFASGLL